MNWLQLLEFLKTLDPEDDKETLEQSIEVFDGNDFFRVRLAGILGVENGGLLLIPLKARYEDDEEEATDTE